MIIRKVDFVIILISGEVTLTVLYVGLSVYFLVDKLYFYLVFFPLYVYGLKFLSNFNKKLD